MILTEKAKKDFENYVLNKELNHDSEVLISVYNQETLFINYKNIKETLLNALIIEWFDSVGVYINIETYIGVGDVVFYFCVINRIADFIDEHYSSVNDDFYFGTRQEAIEKAIKKANEIYNEKK